MMPSTSTRVVTGDKIFLLFFKYIFILAFETQGQFLTFKKLSVCIYTFLCVELSEEARRGYHLSWSWS